MNDNFDINKKGKAVKKARAPRKPDMTAEENALIINWLEFRYDNIYGRGHSATVRDDKKAAWDAMIDEIDAVHDGKFERNKVEIEKRINNIKKLGITETQCNVLRRFVSWSGGGVFKHLIGVHMHTN